MEFIEQNIYHIYNRGNDKQPIFFNERNYAYFLRKVKKYIVPHCEILAWCLMPNHFHFMIYADERTSTFIPKFNPARNVLSEAFRNLLSAYAKGVNKQEGKVGNLFQQNTKSKCITPDPANLFLKRNNYVRICYHYIHQNPWRAGLVKRLESWPYSSLQEYLSNSKNQLSNPILGAALVDIPIERLLEESYAIIDFEEEIHIFSAYHQKKYMATWR